MIGKLILTMALTVPAARGPAGNEQDAWKALAKATYKETGLDEDVKDLERKFIPERIRIYGGWTAQIIRISKEKKISYEWTF